jgi:drug/metabolite transporter (DMT)-like permease
MNHVNRKEIIASIYIIIAGICWGIIGIFSRTLLDFGFDSIQISMLRCLVTAISLLIMALATDRSLLYVSIKDIWMFLGSGILSIAFFNICYFISISENSLSLAAILLYTAPSIVVVMSAMVFKEKITKRKVLAMIISFTGALFATGAFAENIQISLIGLLVGLGSGLGYALYSIFGRIALNKYNWLTVMTYTFIFASITLLPFSRPIEVYRMTGDIPITIASVLAIGIISTLLPFLLYTKGLEYLEVGKAALLAFVEPLVATVVGVVVFQEGITIFNSVGILLIILSLVVLNINFSFMNSQDEELKLD